MSTRFVFILTAILLLVGSAIAQPHPEGAVTGLVSFENGDPAIGACVELAGVNGGEHHHSFLRAFADAQGLFNFPHVPAGGYTIAAGLPMHGHASELIEVVAGQTTNVTLALLPPPPPDTTGGHHHHDSLTVVDLQGSAIVVQTDPSLPAHYFLDVDGDGTADFRLSFGPPWYNPASGAVRPSNGDMITIHGALLTYSQPPVVVVLTINGLVWRDPLHGGHGGHGGGDHHQHGCDVDSLVAVELAGTAIVRVDSGFHGEYVRYAIDTDGNDTLNFALDFGGPNYVPESGATRPANGDAITIVGGMFFCPGLPVPVVIVYEINGLLWREPGDTTTMGAMATTAVDEPVVIGAPVSFLTAHNYPNPFNPVTTINYSIPAAGNVTVAIFDITGREVATLVNSFQNAGSYAIAWNGLGQSSGIYFYRVALNGRSFTGRMVLMK